MTVKRADYYFRHDELCELLDVPKDSGILADDSSFIFWPPASAWRLSVRVGSKEEIEQLAEIEE